MNFPQNILIMDAGHKFLIPNAKIQKAIEMKSFYNSVKNETCPKIVMKVEVLCATW